MITTVTLNPAIDCFAQLSGKPMVDEVNRATSEVFKAGGKGLNVSRVLSVLGVPSEAVVVLGGFTGAFIEQEMKKLPGVSLRAVEGSGMTRINMKAHYDRAALCINGKGPESNRKCEEEILGILKESGQGNTVVVSGSMMQNEKQEFILEIAEAVHSAGGKLVIDMESISKDILSKAKPDLIKPNLYELGILNGREVTREEAPEVLREMTSKGIGSVLCSMGRYGAVLCESGKIYEMHQPDTVLVNKVGTGDAMLAGYLAGKQKGKSSEEALILAGACGNATASTLEDVNQVLIRKYLPQISVTRQQ